MPMDIKKIADAAFKLDVRAKTYSEKCRIIRDVAITEGRKGIALLECLTTCAPNVGLEKYAALDRYFEDRNRCRRQRKPKKRVTCHDLIKDRIQAELDKWQYLERSDKYDDQKRK